MNIAIVTGASSGIGREFARQIAGAYASLSEIWVIARREEALLELQRELPGVRLRILSWDLEEKASFLALEQLLKQEKPCVRILVNAAGLGRSGRVEEQEWKDNASVLDVNCRALTAVTMICLPYMKRGSRIIQVDSGAAFLPQPGFAVYAASKAYVLSFSRSLGEELREHGITVTAVCPGPVDTDFFRAGGITLSPFKRRFLIKPGKVVRRALFDAEAGKAISICSLSIRLVRMAGKILPHGVLMRIMNKMF